MSFFRDLRNFFKYNRSERRGVGLLLILLVLIFLARTLIPEIKDDDTKRKQAFQQRLHKFEAFLDSLDQLELNTKVRIDTATRTDWLSLGLREWQVDIIENYKAAGGKLHMPEDLRSIYGIDSAWLAKNEAAILPAEWEAIDSTSDVEHSSQLESREEDRPAQPATEAISNPNQVPDLMEERLERALNIDINRASKTELQRIRGVGEKRAEIILNYRRALGGFHSKSQIAELYAIPDEVKQEIKEQIIIDSTALRKLSIEKSSFKDFLRHPYLDYFYTKLIFDRASSSNFKIEQLNELPELSDSLYSKISPYLSD